MEIETTTTSITTSTTTNTTTIGRWSLLNILGSGATSTVYLGLDQANGQRSAVKVFTATPEVSLELLHTETYLLKTLNHSNILSFVEALENVQFTEPETGSVRTVCALAMEYADRGEFFSLLEEKGSFGESASRNFFLQLLGALEHMHDNNIAHRDVKLENILLDANCNIKLADFGYSSRMTSGKLFKNAAGTSLYFAPEIHAGLPHSGEQADMFAAAIILFTMVTGHMPFSKATSEDRVYSLFLHGEQATFWAFHEKMMNQKVAGFKFSSEFKDLMSRMLAVNPADRLSLEEVASHCWVKGVSEEESEKKSKRMAPLSGLLKAGKRYLMFTKGSQAV